MTGEKKRHDADLVSFPCRADCDPSSRDGNQSKRNNLDSKRVSMDAFRLALTHLELQYIRSSYGSNRLLDPRRELRI